MEGILKGFRIYLLPGLVLQSVIVAGGYGTGREVVEYFTRHGIQTAWTGFLVAFLSFALVFCLCLEHHRESPDVRRQEKLRQLRRQPIVGYVMVLAPYTFCSEY